MRTFSSVFLLLGLVAACKQAPECIDNGQCGDMQACVDDKCKDVECLDSSTCTLHQFCDTKAYTCRDGCGDDEDCRSGEICLDDAKCHSRKCRNATLDCNVGQECVDGDCQDYQGLLCDTCDPYDELLGLQPCGPQGSCWLLEGASETVGFCFPECNPNAEDACPSGFSCEEFPDGTHGCFAYCPTLLKNGWLEL